MATGDEISGPMDLGNPIEFSIRELAEEVIALTGSRSEIIYMPLPSDDPKQRQPDISYAREALRWEPKIALRDGLVKTIAYFEQEFMKN